MTIVVRLFGRELFALAMDLDDEPAEEVTRSIGFASAELADTWEAAAR